MQLQVASNIHCRRKLLREAATSEVVTKQAGRVQGTCREQDGLGLKHAAVCESDTNDAARIAVLSEQFDRWYTRQEFEIGVADGPGVPDRKPLSFARLLEETYAGRLSTSAVVRHRAHAG